MERLIKNELLNEQYYEIDHKSGLKIFVMEKPEYSGAFAMFGTKYGSVDTCFRIRGQEDYVSVPEGIAHFLEHKLWQFSPRILILKYFLLISFINRNL